MKVEILLLMIIALLSVIVYLNVKNLNKVKTVMTLGVKIRGDNLYFTKEFSMFVPQTDRIDIFDERFVVHDYNFEPLNKTLRIFAISENLEAEIPGLLLKKFKLDGWRAENIKFIPE